MLVVACVILPLLLYIPGMLIGRTLLGPTHESDLTELHYERVMISALLNGWLALLLAECGMFSIWLHCALILFVCVVLFFWIRRQPNDRTLPKASSRRQQFEALAFAIVGLVAFVLVLRPFEVILGVRDAGVYATTGFAIARTGGIVQHDQLLAQLAQNEQSADHAVSEPAAQAMTNFIGVQNPERFIATRLRAVGFFVLEGEAPEGRVVPQGLHLLPAWIGLLTSLGGYYVGLWAPCLLGLLGAWSVGMLGRRLAGFWVGLLAFAFLALNSTQVWFSRYSTAETAMQFLLFAGLYAFAKMTMEDTSEHPEHQSSGIRRSVFYAIVAGVALGQIGLARIDFFLASGPAAPLVLYLLYMWLTHRWQRVNTALTVAFGLMVLHAALHIFFISRAYFFDTAASRLRDYAITATLALPFLTETMREVTYTTTSSPLKDPMRIWRELAVVVAGIVALMALYRWPRPVLFGEALVRRWSRLALSVSAVLILLLAGWAYFVRPGIIDGDMITGNNGGWSDPLDVDPVIVQHYWVEGQRLTPTDARQQFSVVLDADAAQCSTTLNHAATEALRAQVRAQRGPWQGPFSVQTPNWLRLQGYIGAPVSVPWCQRAVYAIPQANMVRVGWYVSPLGMVLACLGFALWWRRMNAASWLLLVVSLLATFFYVRQTYGTGDQTYIYILRRFVPIVYPALSLGMAYAIASLGQQRRLFQRGSQIAAGALALLLMGFFVFTGLPIFRHVEYAGAVAQIEQLARRFNKNDIVLMRGGGSGFERDVPDLIATPLHFAFGVDALTVKSRYPSDYANALGDQVRIWQAAGRSVYVAYSSSGADFALPGFRLDPLTTFELNINEFEQLRTQKPRNVQTLRLPLSIYKVEPGTPGQIATIPANQTTLTTIDFAAQVRGFYRPEPQAAPDGSPFVWTDGDALVRIPWPNNNAPRIITLRLAGGLRPDGLGPAEVCIALFAEQRPQLPDGAAFTQLGCQKLTPTFSDYTLSIDPQTIGASATKSALLRIQSRPWIPAEQDPRQLDTRPVGIQFSSLTLGR